MGANNNITLVAETVSYGSSANLTTMFNYEGAPLGENQFPPRGVPHELPTRPWSIQRANEQGESCVRGCDQPGLGASRRSSENSAQRSRTEVDPKNWTVAQVDSCGKLRSEGVSR